MFSSERVSSLDGGHGEIKRRATSRGDKLTNRHVFCHGRLTNCDKAMTNADKLSVLSRPGLCPGPGRPNAKNQLSMARRDRDAATKPEIGVADPGPAPEPDRGRQVQGRIVPRAAAHRAEIPVAFDSFWV